MDSSRESRSLGVEKAATQLIWETNRRKVPGWKGNLCGDFGLGGADVAVYLLMKFILESSRTCRSLTANL